MRTLKGIALVCLLVFAGYALLAGAVLLVRLPFILLSSGVHAAGSALNAAFGLGNTVMYTTSFVLGPVLTLALVVFLVAAGLHIVRHNRAVQTPGAAAGEEHLLRDVHRSLARMDRRIDNLETLLLEKRSRTGTKRRVI